MDNIDFLSKLENTHILLGQKYEAVASLAKKVEFLTHEFRKIVGKRPFSHVKKSQIFGNKKISGQNLGKILKIWAKVPI